MTPDIRRYFIELQLNADDTVPRNREAALRHAQAEKFLSKIATWLNGHELKDKVASMAITAMGQVQITCEQDLISRLCEDESLNIAAVRSGGTLAESRQRIGMR